MRERERAREHVRKMRVLEHRARIGERDRATAEARDRVEGGIQETVAANLPLPPSRRNTGALLAEQNAAFAAQRQRQRHLHEPFLTRLARIFNDSNERDADSETDELNDNEHWFRWEHLSFVQSPHAADRDSDAENSSDDEDEPETITAMVRQSLRTLQAFQDDDEETGGEEGEAS